MQSRNIVVHLCVCAQLLQSCLTLCDPMDCSPPGSSVLGVFQAMILAWVAIFFSRGIFLTQGLNPGLLHSRQIPYGMSYKGSPLHILFKWRKNCPRCLASAPYTQEKSCHLPRSISILSYGASKVLQVFIYFGLWCSHLMITQYCKRKVHGWKREFKGRS